MQSGLLAKLFVAYGFLKQMLPRLRADLEKAKNILKNHYVMSRYGMSRTVMSRDVVVSIVVRRCRIRRSRRRAGVVAASNIRGSRGRCAIWAS